MVYDLERIKSELEILPEWEDQICLQGTKNIKDPFVGIGHINKLPEHELEFKYPLFDIPYINSIIEEHELYRVRLMRLKSKTCYTYHNDWGTRFHLPIITNDKCFFVIEDIVSRYPADGNFYMIDVSKTHTAINASLKDRIHLIGDIYDSNTYNR